MYLATPGPLAVTMITSHMAAIHDLTIAGLFIGKAGERAAQSHPRLTAAPGRPASNEGQERCTEVRANAAEGRRCGVAATRERGVGIPCLPRAASRLGEVTAR